jgi:ABC-type Na+ efflux pump permease subunit
MSTNKWNLALALGLLLAVLLACSATTANISSLKVSADEEGKNERKSFKPGDKVYAVATIANNGGKVQAKFRVLFDDVEGQKAGTLVQGAEKTLDIEGSRPAIFWITLPAGGFQNGRYKFEVSMLTETGEQKDQKTATFDVSGYEKQ